MFTANRAGLISMSAPDRHKAKRLILEIIRQAKGGLGKTQLFKAFWLSHLYYAQIARGYLTDWRIVRMPHGPGIDDGDDLLHELVEEGLITQRYESKGALQGNSLRNRRHGI